jgi:dihydroceramidase
MARSKSRSKSKPKACTSKGAAKKKVSKEPASSSYSMMAYLVLGSLSACTAFAYYVLGSGPPTIDWCEENYLVTPYVKEFFNCLSMVPWIVSSAYGTYKAVTNRVDRWVSTAYALSLSIAVGSYLFHAELTRFTQALDELPMLWLGLHSTALFYELTAYESTKPLQRHADAILIVGSAVITYLYCCTESYEQFLLPYTVVTVLTFLFLLKHILTNQSKKNRAVGLTGFVSMATGALLWAVELHTCRDWLKLHAFWHLGVGIATYTVIGYAGMELKGVKRGLLF